MGKPVTVDSDDLEVLLNAAAGIRHVEDALNAVRQDPAMRRIYKSGKIGQALDRVNRARAHTIKDHRAGPPDGWSPSSKQVKLLVEMNHAGDEGVRTTDVEAYAQLRLYGLCIAGQENVFWGDKTAMASQVQRMRLTDIGRGFFNPTPPCNAPKEITNG